MVNASDLPELAAIFKAAIAAHLAPLREEVAVLKARLEERPVAKDGAPGRDAPAVDVEALFARLKEAIPVAIKGDPGEPGKDGKDGQNGKDGADGIGKDGVSVDLETVGELVASAVHDAVKAIPVPKDGADGRDGYDGKDGASIDPLVIRGMVLDAVAAVVKELPAPKDGRDGRDGKDGRDGAQGAAGTDGSAIDYVDLEPAKSYPRGTHARHRGGILYAERTTDPVEGNGFKAAGWFPLVAGVADVKLGLLSDGRTFELALEFSDGRTETRQTKADIPAHRGVWRESVTYERGDLVQWSGNGWIAREVTTDKPGDSKSWDLLARRGRDGKDA